MALPGLPKGLDNVGADLAEFKATMARVEAHVQAAADAAVGALIAEWGVDRAAELVARARQLRAAAPPQPLDRSDT